jgi:hypothetical protein
MDWNVAKKECLDKWHAIRNEVGLVTVAKLLDDITEACAFCDIAGERQEQAKSAGSTHARLRCLFCEAYLYYGGCKDRVDALTAVVLNEDWEATARHVYGMIEWIDSMEPVPVAA